MLTPDGLSGDHTDKIMLLATWTNSLKKEVGGNTDKPFILAGMGRPTFPVNLFTVEIYLEFWQAILALIKKAQLHPEMITESLALDYGDGRGDLEPRTSMAEAMTDWYKSEVNADNVLFTVGGAGALRVVFDTFNDMYKDTPNYRVITPFPHYSLYKDKKHTLHPVDVMKEPGYQLTANALEESIKSAIELGKKDNRPPKVVLLCNPSNPLGTVISEVELKKIADVLRKYPDLKLVIDEAYAEMVWGEKKIPSILEIAPDLKDRIIILRSATKALSAAGERMAMLMAFDKNLMNLFRSTNISTIGHAPRSAQIAYAHTMKKFGEQEKQSLKEYYLPKVEYVLERAIKMGAAMPDRSYKIEGTFYVLCDFSELIGDQIPAEAQKALGEKTKIETDEDLIYSLLFKDHVMVAPGSYFGMPDKNGIVRITCSGGALELRELMDRLEERLSCVRQKRMEDLANEIKLLLNKLKSDNDFKKTTFSEQYENVLKSGDGTSLGLKTKNEALAKMLNSLKQVCSQLNPGEKTAPILSVYSFYNNSAKKDADPDQNSEEKQWKEFVNQLFSGGDNSMKDDLLKWTPEGRTKFLPWVEYKKCLSGVERRENIAKLE